MEVLLSDICGLHHACDVIFQVNLALVVNQGLFFAHCISPIAV
jgi:hypothetical protein